MNKLNKNRKTMFKISCHEMKFDLFWCLSFISNLHLRFRHDYIFTFICKLHPCILRLFANLLAMRFRQRGYF